MFLKQTKMKQINLVLIFSLLISLLSCNDEEVDIVLPSASTYSSISELRQSLKPHINYLITTVRFHNQHLRK